MDFSLERPIRYVGNQTMPDWIMQNVVPFFIITLYGAKTTIPVETLPKMARVRLGGILPAKSFCELRLPKLHPRVEAGLALERRRGEQM